jgi:hypothetical protein
MEIIETHDTILRKTKEDLNEVLIKTIYPSISELHPHLKPKKITAEEKIKKIKKWLEEYENKISYKYGKELHDIIES